jgi:hypothetical protein
MQMISNAGACYAIFKKRRERYYEGAPELVRRSMVYRLYNLFPLL